jgi:PAS domain S-box-containing protein
MPKKRFSAEQIIVLLRQIKVVDVTGQGGRGDLSARVQSSKLEELGTLAATFNNMAAKLQKAFDDLVGEVEMRKTRERDLQESETRLRASEERWRLVFENSTLGIMLIDHDQHFMATNRALHTMIGYTAQELQKLSPVDLVAEDEREATSHRLAELRTGERANYEVVTRYRRKDSSSIWVNTFLSTIPGSKNSPPLHIATAIDITDRHKAESELRRFATYLAEAEKLSHTGCWAVNTKTGELFWSQEEWRIFGLQPETTKLSYQVFLDLVHPEDRAALEENSLRAVRNKEPYDVLFRAVLRDGTIKHLHTVGKPQIEESGAVVEYIGVTMDETERVRANAAMHEAQAELARVARFTTIGELIASIAHEIKQPLGAIVTNGSAGLRWLERAAPDCDEARAAFTRIVNDGRRADEVIESIRAVFRNVDQEKSPVDINKLIRDMLGLMIGDLRSNRVSVETRLDDNLPDVIGNQVQLQQVILNLIRNAIEAMNSVTDHARVLRIGTAIHVPDGVLVSVEDSGTGLNPKDIERIFDSFFTTKPQGTGMGLSICRSIIEGHQGRLWASSGINHGAIFNVLLPAFGPANGEKTSATVGVMNCPVD